MNTQKIPMRFGTIVVERSLVSFHDGGIRLIQYAYIFMGGQWASIDSRAFVSSYFTNPQLEARLDGRDIIVLSPGVGKVIRFLEFNGPPLASAPRVAEIPYVSTRDEWDDDDDGESVHENGDCEPSDCIFCENEHDNNDCGGVCYHCMQEHENGDCEPSDCMLCENAHRDGDCESSDCYYCELRHNSRDCDPATCSYCENAHRDGDCGGVCYHCVQEHEAGDCDLSECRLSHPAASEDEDEE